MTWLYALAAFLSLFLAKYLFLCKPLPISLTKASVLALVGSTCSLALLYLIRGNLDSIICCVYPFILFIPVVYLMVASTLSILASLWIAGRAGERILNLYNRNLLPEIVGGVLAYVFISLS